MRQSATVLEAFYATRLGQAAADRIGHRLLDLWGPCAGEAVVCIGYPQPVLPIWLSTARTCVGATPDEAGQSRLNGPRGGVIVHAPEHRLPFGDGVFDRIILLHALEEADHPRLLMREVWRVLAPEGRMIVAVTNRKSLWSINDRTAFGHGRPWTRRQLVQFMTDSLFQVTASTTAVHMPPLDWRLITAAAKSWERVGEWVAPGLGGVVLVEAVKRLYAKPGGSAAAPMTQAVKAGNLRPSMPRKQAEAGEQPKSSKSAIDAG